MHNNGRVIAETMITVFTPTYNRAHLLTRLYESLCKQTYKDFEWIIVDDGSTDQTESLIKNFELRIKTNGSCGNSEFKELNGIRYIRQANGGKHRAINCGVQEARGDLFFIVDSDDLLPPQALETIAKHYQQICLDNRFAGVSGLRCYDDGKKVGGEQPFGVIDCNALDIRYKHHIKGDLAEVFRTVVLREFPFPEFDGEKFCPEALVWNRIAQKYILRYFYENVYECEYQEGGLTDRIVKVRMQSPMASTTCYQEMVSYDIPLKEKIKAAINYWRFAACLPNGAKAPRLAWYWRWCQPAGLLMHLRDSRL